MSLDNTFKAAKKASVASAGREHNNPLKGGILSILNEANEIIGWVS